MNAGLLARRCGRIAVSCITQVPPERKAAEVETSAGTSCWKTASRNYFPFLAKMEYAGTGPDRCGRQRE